MPVQPSIHIPLTLVLREETAKQFQDSLKDVPFTDWLATRARLWFENYANGGVMLSPDQVKKIEETVEKPVSNGSDVVNAVGASRNIQDGSHTFLLTLDPTWVQPLKDRAAEMGRTPEELIDDMFSIGMENNWAYSLDRPTGAEVEKGIQQLVTEARKAVDRAKALEAPVEVAG
jgi:hypothetical protein